MPVAALAPHLGHDRAAQIAKKARREGTRREASAPDPGDVPARRFDGRVRPERIAAARIDQRGRSSTMRFALPTSVRSMVSGSRRCTPTVMPM